MLMNDNVMSELCFLSFTLLENIIVNCDRKVFVQHSNCSRGNILYHKFLAADV